MRDQLHVTKRRLLWMIPTLALVAGVMTVAAYDDAKGATTSCWQRTSTDWINNVDVVEDLIPPVVLRQIDIRQSIYYVYCVKKEIRDGVPRVVSSWVTTHRAELEWRISDGGDINCGKIGGFNGVWTDTWIGNGNGNRVYFDRWGAPCQGSDDAGSTTVLIMPTHTWYWKGGWPTWNGVCRINVQSDSDDNCQDKYGEGENQFNGRLDP